MNQPSNLFSIKQKFILIVLALLVVPAKSFAFDYYEASGAFSIVESTFSSPEASCVTNMQEFDSIDSQHAYRLTGINESAPGFWSCEAELTILSGPNAGDTFIRLTNNGAAFGRQCQPAGSNGAPWRDAFCNFDPNSDIEIFKTYGQCPTPVNMVGNPVHPATGNKFQVENDFATGNALSFTRYYNSMSENIYGLGKGWSATYFQNLLLSSVEDRVLVNRADGFSDVLDCPQPTGTCVLDSDLEFTLERTASGFTLVTENDDVEEYDTDGKLLSTTPKSGETQTLSYDATTELLETVTDTYGRTLNFTYDIQDRLSTVTDPDSEVYTYTYDNDTDDNLITVVFPDDTPGNANDNPSKQYEYTDTNFPNHLTAIIDENGNTFASFGYDTQGRAIFTEHDNGAERIDLAYNVDGTTTVTDSLGASNTYNYEISFGVPRTSNVTGGQCGSGCTNEGQAQTYDVNGFLASRTDFEGNITNFTSNARGLQESRTEAVGSPQARTITTEWHPAFRLPTKISEPGKETTFIYDTQGRLLSRSETALP